MSNFQELCMHLQCLQRSDEVSQHFCAQGFGVSVSPEQSEMKRKTILSSYTIYDIYALKSLRT